MWVTPEFLQSSQFPTIHRQRWDTRTACQFRLRCFTAATDPWSWTEDIRCSIFLFVEYLSNNAGWYIIEPFWWSFVQNTSSLQMADQYDLIPEDYVDDLKNLSNERYSQGMLFFILLFPKQRLKHFQAVIAPLMLYDLVYHIPQQVGLSLCEQFIPHISSLLGSIPPRACFAFNDRLLPLTFENSGGNGQNCMSSI